MYKYEINFKKKKKTASHHPRCTHVLENLRILNNDLLRGCCRGRKQQKEKHAQLNIMAPKVTIIIVITTTTHKSKMHSFPLHLHEECVLMVVLFSLLGAYLAAAGGAG